MSRNTDAADEPRAKRRGPPNRMNDLPYREWMKYQKSFFRHESDQRLVEDAVHFFTKARWPDGRASRSLVVGFDFDEAAIEPPRCIEHVPAPATASSVPDTLPTEDLKYDFALVDLRTAIADRDGLEDFVGDPSDTFFQRLRTRLGADRYCGVVVPTEEPGGGGFPLPWSVALAARRHLRLRDEKVGLVEAEGRVFYVLFFQACDDAREPALFTPQTVLSAPADGPIPAWTIPKPPPRKRNEILHPAKYPETLVAPFIELFTKPGDAVFDPMAGTGSTLVAAVELGRMARGVELSVEYAQIAQQRVDSASAPTQFSGIASGAILQGDATRLDDIDGLDGVRFNYAITSPPYWSMLTNPGSENQRNRRQRNLATVYSESEDDLGNVAEYETFLGLLADVYEQVADRLVDSGCLTVVVKNVKRQHVLYPLAWDLVARLCGPDGRFEYLGTTLWCQDDVGLKPFAVGIHWVSNIVHQYCLHFRRRGSVSPSA